MSQLLVTKQGNAIVSASHHSERGIFQFHIVPDTNQPGKPRMQIGDIYLGQVQNIVKNIEAAFVELAPGINGYLPFSECQYPCYANPKNTDRICIGDKLLVQIRQEPVKSKPVSLTTDLTLSGKYVVLFPYHPGIKISSKIKEKEERERLLAIGEKCVKESGYGCLFRTNAAEHSEEELSAAVFRLIDQVRAIRQRGQHSIRYTRLYAGIPAYLADVRDAGEEELEKIQTDDESLYLEMKEFLQENQPEDVPKLHFYQESFSLNALYSIEVRLKKALEERVWMKSGAYLVIQPTEALTVIDVNSGKAVRGKKDTEETALAINLEAATEIAAALRLRNLSGIIIIDFINLKEKEHMDQVLVKLKGALQADPVKTVLVDKTELGLVEVTRKRMTRPLHEYRQILFP